MKCPVLYVDIGSLLSTYHIVVIPNHVCRGTLRNRNQQETEMIEFHLTGPKMIYIFFTSLFIHASDI